jgi:two-component system, LuxR family, response regulator FixJ
MNGASPDEPGDQVPTIFVVDDDESLCRSLARLVRAAGWNVETFASARDFLDRQAYGETGCVVMDVQMPGMTGPELHRQMTERGISLPVVFLTGHGDLPTGVQAMKRGAVDFLSKPVDGETLLETLREGIQRHAIERAGQRRRLDIELRLARLSPREREVLELVIGGHLNKQVADRMSISIKTVKAHRARVMEKMEVDSLAALIRLCENAAVEFSQRQSTRARASRARPATRPLTSTSETGT